MSTENKNWISEEDSPRLKFTRNWENSMDFPTHEVSEAQVRKDMQALHDEVKDFINDEVIADLVRLGVGEIARAPEGAGFKYVRLNRDRVFEVSNDGIEWEATSSSGGHLILNESGEVMPQRSRIKFEGSTVTDDGENLVVEYADDGSLDRHKTDPDAHVAALENLKRELSPDLPHVGDIRTSILTNLGDNWLLCNGDALSATEYPDLFAILQDLNPPHEMEWSTKTEVWDANGYHAPINDMAHGEGYYVAVGLEHPYTSSEKAQIVRIAVAPSLAGPWSEKVSLYTDYENAAATSVAYGNGMFVAGGYWRDGDDPYNMYGLIYYADDPSGTWTRKNLWSSSVNENKVTSVAYGDGTWVAAGEYRSGANYYARIAYAATPSGTWTTKDIFTGTSSSRFQIKSVAYAEGCWVVAGQYYDGSKYHARVMYATSLTGTWSTVDLWGDANQYNDATDVVYGDGVWAVVGSYYKDGDNNGAKIAYSSSLGGEWVTVDPNTTKFSTGKPVSIAYSCGLWAIGGQKGGASNIGLVAFAKTLDGEWHPKEMFSYSSSYTYLTRVKNVNGMWVAMGNEYSSNYGNGIFVTHSTVLPTITTDGAYCYIKAKE